jgi:hypothetical protein
LVIAAIVEAYISILSLAVAAARICPTFSPSATIPA